VEALEARDVPSGAGPHVLKVIQGDPGAPYQTIQAAVNAARPGDTIEIFDGNYKEAVTVSTPGLTLTAAPGARVVIQNPGHAANGVTVADPSGGALTGFKLEHVTVRGFKENGVFLSGVTGFVLRDVTARNNGLYGLFPVLSADGLITQCTASGSNDTGIYVGQSQDVVVRDNVAFNNVNGIEIENSVGVRAVFNTVHHNTVGILEDLLPGFPLAFEVAADNTIAGNTVFANNRRNTAPKDDIAAVEPPGTGIAVVGGDHARVVNNTVSGNAFAGIAVLSGNDLLALAPQGTPHYPAGVDPNADNTLVRRNQVLGNGFLPSVPPGFPQPADLVWTGTGTNNHWQNNVFATSTPAKLP
jgi:parallel beta-helix repeat protein